jgi:diguanylate cyclase (GGDEF)-like protein
MDIAERGWTRFITGALLLLVAALLVAGLLNAQRDLQGATSSAGDLRNLRAAENAATALRTGLIGASQADEVANALMGLERIKRFLTADETTLLESIRAKPSPAAAARLEASIQSRFDALLAERLQTERDSFDRAIAFSLALVGSLALAIALFVVGYVQRGALIQRLEWQATTDGLTGVLNRRAWDRALLLALERAARGNSVSSVVMLDLDHFKRFNDRYGHPAGDKVLRLTAQVLQRSTRVTDTVARYGGEEFALCLEGCAPEDARALLERLRTDIPANMTFSAGVTGTRGAESASAVLERADKALYAAKRAGRNRVMLSDELKPTGEVVIDLKSSALT